MASNADLQNSEMSTTQETLSSGKSWEHPWSIDEIRKSAEQWSLAADVGLLEHMKDFASRLTAQAHDVSREVSQLLHDTRLTDAKIQSVTDYFLTLSDSQFIENRVYDEDDAVDEKKDEKPATKNKTREEREAEMLPRLKEAVGIGLNVIEDAYDVLDVDVDNSDSEEDDLPSDEVILDPKDPYVSRPLPHLIGSRSFHQEDDVGVGELLSGDELESEVGSVSESEDEIEKAPSVSDVSSSDYESDEDSGTDASEDDIVTTKKRSKSNSSSDNFSSSEDGDLFGNKTRSSDDVSSVSEEPVQKKRAQSKKSQKQEQGMFEDADEDDNDLFSGSGALFGKTGGLFDAPKGDLFEGVDGFGDDDDDEEVNEADSEAEEKPEPVVEKRSKKPEKKTPVGGVSLFGGAIKKGFFQDDAESEDENDDDDGPPPLTTTSNKKPSNLFDDDDDSDEGGLFSDKPPPFEAAPKSEPALKKSGGLFDESDEDDLFGEPPPPVQKSPAKERKSSGAKRPTGGVSMFGAGGGALQDALRNRGVSSTSTSSSTAGKSESKAPKSNDQKLKSDSQPKSLFDDDDDDDLFGSSILPPKNKTSSKEKKATVPHRNLFADSSDENDGLFSSSATTSQKQSSIRSGSVPSKGSAAVKKSQLAKKSNVEKLHEDPLFDNAEDSTISDKIQKVAKEPTTHREKSDSKSNLFDLSDSDSGLFKSSNQHISISQGDDEPFSKPPPLSSATKSSKAESSGLFGDSSSDDEIRVKSAKPLVKKPQKKQTSLFDDNASDDDDDLFGGLSKSKPAPAKGKPPAKKPTDSLFGDDVNDNEVKKSANSKPVANKKSKDLFDSDSDDDLFGTKINPPAINLSPDSDKIAPAQPKEDVIDGLSSDTPKKKPAGAVSMFGAGGGELLAALSKKRSESHKSSVSSSSDKEVKAETNGALSENVDEKKTAKPVQTSNVTAKPFTLTSPMAKPTVAKVSAPVVKSGSGVEKLQASLTINPAALLPGVTPSIKSTVDVNAPLESVTKTRSRGQAGRRPPTRRGRKKVAESTEADGVAPVDFTSPFSSPETAPATTVPTTKKPTPDKSSLIDDDFLNDILSPSFNSVAADEKKSSSVKKKNTKLPSLFDDTDDLFGPPKDVTNDSGDIFPSKTKKLKVENDLFSDDLTFEPDTLFTPSNKKTKSKAPKLFEDDIFAEIEPKSDKKKTFTALENGDDDLFSVTPVKSKKKTKAEVASLDADDLFGDVTLTTTSKKKSSKSKDLFNDDDDDLFGDLPPSKPKEKKKAPAADSLFDDDDLFSPISTAASSAKVSKPTKKSAEKTAKEEKESPLFDDPLNALLGP